MDRSYATETSSNTNTNITGYEYRYSAKTQTPLSGDTLETTVGAAIRQDPRDIKQTKKGLKNIRTEDEL